MFFGVLLGFFENWGEKGGKMRTEIVAGAGARIVHFSSETGAWAKSSLEEFAS